MVSEPIETLLAALGESLGVGALTLDEHDRCGLQIDEVVVDCRLDRAGGRIILLARLGAVPELARVATYARLLDANVFWAGTGGATLSLAEAGDVTLHRCLPVDGGLDRARLRTALEAFVNAAEDWQERLTRARSD